MQLFSADAKMLKKNLNFVFLPTKSWKNGPQKLLIIGPNLFSQSSPAHSPELIFHIINMSQDTSISLSVDRKQERILICFEDQKYLSELIYLTPFNFYFR